MKKLIYLIVLALVLGLVFTGCLLSNVGQVPTINQSGITYLTKGPLSGDLVDLVGLWHFDEGSGATTIADSSGYSNDGIVNGATTGVLGNFGNALSFDGVNDYVDCGAAVDDSITTGITLEAWIKPAFKQNGGIISNDITYSSKKGYDFFLWIAGSSYGRLYIDFGNGSALGRTWWDIPSSDWYNQWHHVAATWDGSVIKLYVDGSKVEEVEYSGTYSDPGKNTFIGAINYSTPANYYFNRLIDEVRIWDGALTTEQIEDSFNYDGIVIQKGMSKDDVFLGDHVTITLEVATALAPATITDTLPDELHYIPDTFMVGNDSATPEVDEQTISYTLNEPCAYTITFDAQVTSVEAKLYTVTNEAMADGALASAELNINPYEGFTKVAELQLPTEDGDEIIEVGEEIEWNITITVANITNDEITYMDNIVIQDRFGGELEIDDHKVNKGFLEVKTSGKTEKPKIKWDGFDLDNVSFTGATAVANLIVSTDVNPGGQQSYSTAGDDYEMNSGAVLKFIDSEGTGFQLSAHTPQIIVVVAEPD